ncbi:MAG: hypothetical protein QME96_08090 [Myxococcota bacterium]|nr:hypothetical protein [Myxococcota bacterium]
MNAPAPTRWRAAFDWPGPGPVPDLERHPQLAVLAVLHGTLSAACHALLAAHPDIDGLPVSAGDRTVCPADLARGLLPLVDELSVLLGHYQDLVQLPARRSVVARSTPDPSSNPVRDSAQLTFRFAFPCRCLPPTSAVARPADSTPPPPALPIPTTWTPREADLVWMFLSDLERAVFDAHEHGLASLWAAQALDEELLPPDHDFDYPDADVIPL